MKIGRYTEGTMLRKWMEFEQCSPPLICLLWWLFKGFKALRCFWRTIFILSHWKLNKGYYKEALWILLWRRFCCRLIWETCCHEIHFQVEQGLGPWPENISYWYLASIWTNISPYWTNTFCNFDKYNVEFGQIHFAVELCLAPWPEDISRWYLFMSLLSPALIGKKKTISLLSFLPFPIQFSTSSLTNFPNSHFSSSFIVCCVSSCQTLFQFFSFQFV